MPEIQICDVTIEFPVYGVNAKSLKNTVLSKATGGKLVSSAKDPVIIRALEDFSMHAITGDRIGLVGHNGAGKSTLLRAICGIYRPSKGSVFINGSLGALIDFGAGLDPEATGLENIYLRGYLLGKSKFEISKKLAKIIEFSELEDFIGLPLRTYSAGMVARLAFSISTSWEHDILIIDEGIGAGDKNFQEKVQKRIDDLFEASSIIVIATHSEDLIRRYCNRTIELSAIK